MFLIYPCYYSHVIPFSNIFGFIKRRIFPILKCLRRDDDDKNKDDEEKEQIPMEKID